LADREIKCVAIESVSCTDPNHTTVGDGKMREIVESHVERAMLS